MFVRRWYHAKDLECLHRTQHGKLKDLGPTVLGPFFVHQISYQETRDNYVDKRDLSNPGKAAACVLGYRLDLPIWLAVTASDDR